jgi:low temperature requirement protein LtrA
VNAELHHLKPYANRARGNTLAVSESGLAPVPDRALGAPDQAAERRTSPIEPSTSAIERRTSPIELLWDLVFVFAITRVTTLLAADLSWAGFGRSMLILALVWWAWSAFVWAANAEASESRELRLYLIAATIFIFIAGLALPRAFGSGGTLFAICYALVRFLHLGLYADASRKGNASWRAIAGFATTVAIGMVLLIVGSFMHGTARIVLWAGAVVIDYAGPAWLTRKRLRGLQQVAVAHFSERYGLFVIICLGESIVAIGLAEGAAPRLTTALIAKVSLGLLITVAMWWTYFDRFADIAEARLRRHSDPVLAAADAYSYVHLAIVAGIIIFAVGVKLLVRANVGEPLPDPARLALCGGVALYLAGHVAFRLRISGEVGYEKLIAAGVLLGLYVASGDVAAWITASAVAALMGLLCVVETAVRPPRDSAVHSHTSDGFTEVGSGTILSDP